VTTEQAWLVAVGALALAALLLALLAWRVAGRALARVEDVATRPAEPEPTPADAASYVITGFDDTVPAEQPSHAPPVAQPVAQPIDGRLFTDIVARETVVRAASWSRGIRRALSPESRNRIAFQVRQQSKQQRRDRRTEAREALREYRARRADDGDAA